MKSRIAVTSPWAHSFIIFGFLNSEGIALAPWLLGWKLIMHRIEPD